MRNCNNCKSFDSCGGVMCDGGPHCDHYRPRHGGPRKKRPVIRSDGKRYESIAAAARDQYGCPAPERIGLCCRGGYGAKSAYGYEWRYADEEEQATA